MEAFRFPLLYAPPVHGTSLVGPYFLLCRTRKHLWPITLLGRSYLSICSNAEAKIMEPLKPVRSLHLRVDTMILHQLVWVGPTG